MSATLSSRLEGSAELPIPPLLDVVDLGKSFGPTRALVSCSFSALPGEVHAVIGENGSGKSTLVKTLSGVLRPDSGGLQWAGEPLPLRTPRDARAAGIATVFQETLTVPELSVVDNLLLGSGGVVRRSPERRELESRASGMLEALGAGGLPLETPLWTLPLGVRQVITIVRALIKPWRLLILDEATSGLDDDQRNRLFLAMREACVDGKAVLFISHRFEEIREVADRVTVLRSGESVATVTGSAAHPAKLLEFMTGGAERKRGPTAAPVRQGDVERTTILRARSLVLRAGAAPADLILRRGEILGLAGLEGHGQLELLEAIVGLGGFYSGDLEVENGGSFGRPRSLRDAFSMGVAYVPRDRKNEGIFDSRSVLDNVTLPSLRTFSRLGVLRSRALLSAATSLAEAMRVVMRGWGVSITTLSGGNQQKLLLARWVMTKPRVLVVNDPLRGVDLRTKLDVYESFRELTRSGMAIVVYSTEIEELLQISDRIVVFHNYGISAMLESEQMSRPAIAAAMFGESTRRDEVAK